MTVDVVLTADADAHSFYADLVHHPPEGVRYVVRPLRWHAPLWGDPVRDALYWKRRGLARRLFGQPDAARLPDWGMPVHTQECVRSPQPWVVDYEHPWAFTGFDGDRVRDAGVRRRMTRMLDEAARLLPWTEAAADATRALLPTLAPKLRVVRPATAPRERAQSDDADAPLVLFVARHFRRKGGPEALEAFARVREAHAPRARMLMVSQVPPEVQARYRDRGVTFLPPTQPREQVLAEGFAKASVYLMPTHYDTFGMVFLEAFSHGVPVVTTDTFAAHEIVHDGEDGFVVSGYGTKWFREEDQAPTPDAWRWEDVHARQRPDERERLVAALADRLTRLLTDPSLAERMGDAAHDAVTRGRFSIATRNAALKAAYREAF